MGNHQAKTLHPGSLFDRGSIVDILKLSLIVRNSLMAADQRGVVSMYTNMQIFWVANIKADANASKFLARSRRLTSDPGTCGGSENEARVDSRHVTPQTNCLRNKRPALIQRLLPYRFPDNPCTILYSNNCSPYRVQVWTNANFRLRKLPPSAV